MERLKKALEKEREAEDSFQKVKGAKTWVELLVVVCVIAFVIMGALTLPKYGLTWDEGLGNLFFGERYFHFFTSFDPAYLDFDNEDLAIHQRPLNLYESPFQGRPQEFPPLADTLSAMTMEIFAYRLGWLDPIDAFHLTKILLCGLLLLVLFHFAAPRLGTSAAFLAILVLGTYPRFWGDMHFNPKDIPETVFFAFTIIAFYIWYDQPSWQRAVAVGILFGASLSIKANAIFLPFVAIMGIWPWRLTSRPWSQVVEHLKKSFRHYALMLGTGVAVHLGTWPYLYTDPFRGLKAYYTFVISQVGRQGRATWNWDPLIQTVTTMPEVVLALLLVGLGFAIWRSRTKSPILRLLVVWFALPLFRISLPGMFSFDGIRHFEEFVPAASLLAGYGGASLAGLIAKGKPMKKRLFLAGLLLLIACNIGSIVLRYHPYEHLYYNSLVGGLSGAHYKYGLSGATDYWASSYRQGMRWLNVHAPLGSALYVPTADWVVRLTAPIWLRQDIDVISEISIESMRLAGHPVYVMFITGINWSQLATYCSQQLRPVHQIIVDGTPILEIYRLNPVEGGKYYIWQEGETFLSRAGSGAKDFKTPASNGQCLGMGWGGSKGDFVEYEVSIRRDLPSAVLFIRYALEEQTNAALDVYLNEQLVGTS
nr:glycosyltransferase family 39 protein [Dehalococcoidia bacterium]